MGCSGYDALARVYEILNSDIDYSAWADFFERCFDKYLDEKPSLTCFFYDPTNVGNLIPGSSSFSK